MKTTPATFLKQLAQEAVPPSVVAIIGEEGYYRDQVRQACFKKIFGDQPKEGWNLEIFAEKTEFKRLDGFINTYPFFGGRSAVLVTDKDILTPSSRGAEAGGTSKAGSERQDKLLQILANLPEYCTVIIQAEKLDGRQKLSKQLQKLYTLVDCAPLKVSNLVPWLKEEAHLHGAVFEPEALQTVQAILLNADFAPLQMLEQEIDKLDLYAGSRKKWTSQDVEQSFASLPEAGRYALTNALADKKLTEVLELLASEERKKINILPITGSVTYQIRRLLQMKECQRLGLSAQAAASRLKLAPFAVNILQRQSRHFTEEALIKALRSLDALSIDIRSGGREYELLTEILAILLQ
jgi:DNA polymerase-3 subunit delta